MMNLEETIKRIESKKRFGDVAHACRIVGVTPIIWQNAKGKKEFDQLTPAETKVVAALIDLVGTREEDMQKIKKYAD